MVKFGHIFLGKEKLTGREELLLLETAYTSLYHWRITGKEVNVQRGEWLLSHVMSGLKWHEMSLAHARLCY
jgi:hypothetical protein